MQLTVYIDGGAINNPGPAAIGVVIYKDQKEWKAYSEPLSYEGTNNQAEFEAALFALEKLKKLLGKERMEDAEVIIKSDSRLLVNQLRGEYKIQDAKLQALFLKIWNHMVDYGGIDSVKFELVPREANKRADQLVKQSLFTRDT